MKRLLSIAFLIITLASIVAAQAPSGATVRTPTGDKPLAVLHQGAQTFFAVDDVITALGGTVRAQTSGWTATLNGVSVAFGSDSRFAVVRDDLIEMPVAPMSSEGKPYATVQFFTGFLSRAASLDATWDDKAKMLQIHALQRDQISVTTSVANVQGISKVVITCSAPADYIIVKEPSAYTVRFKNAIRPPYAELTHEDPNVSKTTFTGSDLRIQLTSPDVVADTYKLDDPFRIVLDLRKGAPAGPTPLTPTPSAAKPTDEPGIHTIVIDAGHGGKDIGASGPTGLLEKDLTLAVCRKLANSLASKTGARIIMTRDDDQVVSLDQRTAIANQYKADLFLSVHMNAAVVRGARGSETYFLSADASDEVARRAAESENKSLSATTTAPTPAASGDVKLVLWDLAQQEYLKESSIFAIDIQEEMNLLAGITNRGVKQAPFKVLVGATMPAALVEVAFITNPEEEAKLKDDKFTTNVVDAITRAVVKYKTDYETRIGVIQPAPATSTAAPAATSSAPPAAKPAPATTTSRTTT